MNEILISAVFQSALYGNLGAIARLAMNYNSAFQMRKKISISSLALYAVVVIVSGTLTGIIFDYGRLGSFLAGFVGLDLMDGYAKVLLQRNIQIKRKSEN